MTNFDSPPAKEGQGRFGPQLGKKEGYPDMRVTSIQVRADDQGKEAMMKRVMGLLDRAPASDLLLLPEIWATGFFRFSHYAGDAESMEGPWVQRLQKKAAALKTHLFTGSFVERDGDHLYNTSLLIDPSGKLAAQYRKIHLFGYQSEESRLLKPGTQAVVVDLPWGKTGFCTCYDLRFPEQFRRMTDLGAEFFLVTSAWPEARREAWMLFNRARAHENLAWLISCNSAGSNDGKVYAGTSMVVDPWGRVAGQAGSDEEILSVEVDPQSPSKARAEFPALKDRLVPFS